MVNLKHFKAIPLVNELVSVKQWDKYEPPNKRIGSPAKVVCVQTGEVCETGVRVVVVGTSGRMLCVDLNWLRQWRE